MDCAFDLLQSGAQFTLLDAQGKSAYAYAKENNHFAIVKLILERLEQKYNLHNSSQQMLEKGLRMSATNGFVDDLKIFIQEVKNINAQDSDPKSMRTAMHWAVIKQRIDCIKILKEAGSYMNIPDAFNKTAEDYVQITQNHIKNLEKESATRKTDLNSTSEAVLKQMQLFILAKNATDDRRLVQRLREEEITSIIEPMPEQKQRAEGLQSYKNENKRSKKELDATIRQPIFGSQDPGITNEIATKIFTLFDKKTLNTIIPRVSKRWYEIHKSMFESNTLRRITKSIAYDKEKFSKENSELQEVLLISQQEYEAKIKEEQERIVKKEDSRTKSIENEVFYKSESDEEDNLESSASYEL